MVWAYPLSLATTRGITIVFFSSGYLDVSVPQVYASRHGFTMTGCPIRVPTDQWMLAPPRSFSQLAAPFLVSKSLGIHYAPLLFPKSIAFPLFSLF